jgi:integrase
MYIGRDPQTGKPRQKWFRFRTLREAEAAQAQLNVQLQGGGFLPNTRLRVSEYLEQWLQDYAVGAVGQTTLRTYQDIVRLHFVPAFGLVPLPKLTPHSIQKFYSQKLQEGLSSTTVNKIHRVLREALGHAVRWGLISRNPATMVDPPRPRKVEMLVWDDEQIRLFLAEAKRSSPYHGLYLTALLTGMRQGELLGLRWQDVDLTVGVASVRQTLYRLGGQLIIKEPKTPKSRRQVALSPIVVEELRQLREKQTEHRQQLGDAYMDYNLVFCQEDGKPLHAHNIVQRDFRRISDRAGLRRIRFHDLRHCHATLLLHLGVHPKIVQERLGHANISMTLDTYSHVVPGMQEQAIRALEARLFSRDMGSQ